MNDRYRQLVVLMLEAYSDYRSNRGCNDLPEKWENILTEDDRKELAGMFPSWNNSKPNSEEDELSIGYDWILISLMAFILKTGKEDEKK